MSIQTLVEKIKEKGNPTAVSYTHLRAHFSVAERALHLGQRQRGQLPRPTLGEQSRRTVQEHSK